MRFGRLGIGFGFDDGPPPSGVPTDIAWAGSHTIAENTALGTQIGGALTATDPNLDEITFSLVDDHDGWFGIGEDGESIIVTGVPDYETDPAPAITIRASDGVLTYDEIFTITLTDVDETTPPPEAPPPDGEVIVDDPVNFDVPPTVVQIEDGIAFNGKKKTGSTGKFIYDLGAANAGRTYTVSYDPDFSLLANLGVSALVGFGFRHGNDFLIVGLKGDGSTGLKAYEVSGANKWNQVSGFTTDDAGAPSHGTQAGPNWVQLAISDDGTEYTFKTSADGVTWTAEYTDRTSAIFPDFTAATSFGIAVFLESADAGPFRIDVSVYQDLIWFTGSDLTLNTNSNVFSGYNVREVFDVGYYSGGQGAMVRLTLEAATNEAFQASSVWIGKINAATVPDWTGSTASDRTQLQVGGSNSFTIPLGQTVVTDPKQFLMDATKPLGIAVHCAGNSSNDGVRYLTPSTGVNHYQKLAADEGSTADVSSYTTQAICVLVKKIEWLVPVNLSLSTIYMEVINAGAAQLRTSDVYVETVHAGVPVLRTSDVYLEVIHNSV